MSCLSNLRDSFSVRVTLLQIDSLYMRNVYDKCFICLRKVAFVVDCGISFISAMEQKGKEKRKAAFGPCVRIFSIWMHQNLRLFMWSDGVNSLRRAWCTFFVGMEMTVTFRSAKWCHFWPQCCSEGMLEVTKI